jgi:hypothetical protein
MPGESWREAFRASWRDALSALSDDELTEIRAVCETIRTERATAVYRQGPDDN